jgi:hypothetical protein
MPLRLCSELGHDGSDSRSLCAIVTNIDAGSYLAIRETPHNDAPEIGRLNNGDVVEVDCWSTGDPDSGGHGYTYWAGLYNPAGPPRYVNDYYLDSGGPEEWQGQISTCP